MKRLIFVVMLAALAWSGWWFWSARALREQTRGWFEARRADGWEARYDDLAILGFPNRLDMTLSNPALSPPGSGTLWQAPFLQIFRLSYKPGHLILIWPEDQTLSTPSGTVGLSDERMRASLILAGSDILRANLEARRLNVAAEGSAIALRDLRAALAHVDAATYRIAATATSPGAAGAEDATLSIDGAITLDRPLDTQSLLSPLAGAMRINLRVAEYRVGAAAVKLSGDLALDARGLAEGALALDIEDRDGLLRELRARDDLPASVAGMLATALELSADRPAAEMEITLRDGLLLLGPDEIGRLPALHPHQGR